MADQHQYDKLFIDMADKFGQLSHCVLYKVGCIIVKDQRIISTGYNGTLPDTLNCENLYGITSNWTREEHHQWSIDNEIHAEMNAILFAAKNGIEIDGATLYSIVQPCANCLKHILQAGIKRIVYKDDYDKANISDNIKEYIKNNNIIMEKI